MRTSPARWTSTPRAARPAPSTTASRRACWPSCRARASCTARTRRRPARSPAMLYRIQDLDLASRLSFFLWGGPPDDAADRHRRCRHACRTRACSESEVRACCAIRAAATDDARLHGRWLNVDGLDIVNTDVLLFPDFTADLIPAFKEELFRFVESVFGEDRSVNELMTGELDLPQRAARHPLRHPRHPRRRFPQGGAGRGLPAAACSARARC